MPAARTRYDREGGHLKTYNMKGMTGHHAMVGKHE